MLFLCVACGFQENTDLVSAMNILKGGTRPVSCAETSPEVGASGQEPTEATPSGSMPGWAPQESPVFEWGRMSSHPLFLLAGATHLAVTPLTIPFGQPQTDQPFQALDPPGGRVVGMGVLADVHRRAKVPAEQLVRLKIALSGLHRWVGVQTLAHFAEQFSVGQYFFVIGLAGGGHTHADNTPTQVAGKVFQAALRIGRAAGDGHLVRTAIMAE
ncbi:hypothetical protein BXU06_06195 [Aquaspirillum sp. LM1]|nr:hypothetical protein BXU06_06195 [Aquaspirillum sp. LM1]